METDITTDESLRTRRVAYEDRSNDGGRGEHLMVEAVSAAVNMAGGVAARRKGL